METNIIFDLSIEDPQLLRNAVEDFTGVSPPAMLLLPCRQEQHLNKEGNDTYRIVVRLVTLQKVLSPITVEPSLVYNPHILFKMGIRDIKIPSDEEWKQTCEVFTSLSRLMPERKIYHYIGHHPDKPEYILGQFKITPSGVTRVDNAFVQGQMEYDAKATAAIWMDCFVGCFKKPIQGAIMLMVFLLSFFLSQLEKITFERPTIVPALIGRTGSFKTSFVQAALTPYGNGAAVFSSFTDSLRGIIETIKRATDTVNIVDDFCELDDRQINEKLEQIIRVNGDRTSSRRVMIGNKIDDRPNNSITIITGEDIPKVKPSSIARMLIFEMTDGIDADALTKLQHSQKKLIGVLIKFIQFLLFKGNAANELLQKFRDYRNELTHSSTKPEWHARYSEMYSWLVAMEDIFVEFCDEQGVDTRPLAKFKEECFEFILLQHKRYLKSDSVYIFFDVASQLVSNGALSIVDVSRVSKDRPRSKYDVIIDGNLLHYESVSVFSAVQKYCADHGIVFQTSRKQLYDTLAHEGLLCRRGGKNTAEYRKYGIRESTICIYRNCLNRYLDQGGDAQ